MDEEKYLKGFNDGYFTAKTMPDIRQSMTFKNVDGPSDYQLGYKDGEKEYALEKQLEKDFSIDDLREKYSKDLGTQDKDQQRSMDKD